MSSQKRKREDVEAGDTFHMIESQLYYPTNKDGITYWTYKLFQGPARQRVRVTYCRTLQECEAAMRRISNSAVLGFDLEWKPYDGPNIKDMVSVIQLASESNIVIIHIAAFPGGREATRQQLLSPALKRILEDDSIIKVGLRISGDGKRMRDQLGVFMKGVIEVAKLRPQEPSLRNPSLSDMTERFFGMPLDKSLSTSTWHYERALREAEIEYAGTDAYAGLKLYQHFIDDHDPLALDFLDFRALQQKKEEKQPDPSSLLEKLKKLRLQLTADPKSKVIHVGSNAVLEAITKHLPTTLSALNRIPGFRSNTSPKYKKAIVELVQDHVKACPQDDNTIDIDSSPNSSQEILSSQPFISSQNDIVSISSSQDSDDSYSAQASQDSITSSTTNIYNTLYFLRQKLSQHLHLSSEEIATNDLLENLAEVRPLSNGALENLGADGFAEMAMEWEGVDVLDVIREG